eukprot:CAMPEP_0197274962 /NCGR_PEP_ID=MMETSP1432-20130617/13343_1 /TAXON_ID=44447 /ORGANISM="Pseudo-nitzschia delicatissima, Strain UNC1205" /LENGTH=332 /DNA_ID=CAMNT_0042740825 /DNA_START=176 /DNA_END=1174 /DNA_ORIENTATION=+
MTKKTNGIAICLLASGATIIQSLQVPSFSARPPATVGSRTVVYSNSNSNDFKDISIDDVLAEAENALNAAQSSLVDTDGDNDNDIDAAKEIKTDFNNIDIDDVLLEAENALNMAGTSLGDNETTSTTTLKDKLRASLVATEGGGKASVEVTEILSSTLGGILMGLVLGLFVSFQLSGIGLLGIRAEFFSEDVLQLAAGSISGGILGGTFGFAGSLQDNTVGIIVRNVLGVPAKALSSAIVGSIQDGIRRQVEKTTNGIKSIPGNVAESAKQTAVQKAREAKLSVDLAIEALFEKIFEKLKRLVVVVAVLSSLVVVGIYATNGELPSIDTLKF